MNLQSWLHHAINILNDSESPYYDARVLLEFVTGKTFSFFLAFGETSLTSEQEIKLSELLFRRKTGEPIAYLIGEQEFWSLPLYVSAATMIPRPDTECLVEQTLVRLSEKPTRILDLGTGTGAIALALASERPDCYITAIDLMPDAVKLAHCNVKRLNMYNVCVFQSNWFDMLSDQYFEIIVSNPPYIDALDPCLSFGDVRFEPRTALVSANKGTMDLYYIIFHAHEHLVRGGWLILEHGWKQGNVIRSYFIQAGYQHVKTYCDYCGNERLTLGKIS